MYTLRKITEKEAVELNFNLGESYTLIRKILNYNEFCKAYELVYNKSYEEQSDDEETKLVYAFVNSTNGAIHPLFNNQHNFIMTEGGKTFDKI